MARVQRTVTASLERVFEVMVDPETYPHWLVGAKEIRSVDGDWPAVGSQFHHRVGLVGPITVADSSTITDISAPHRLELEVRARPFGRAKVEFVLADQPAAIGARTRIWFDEVPIGLLEPLRPLLDPLTARRNERSLDRLDEFLVGTERARGSEWSPSP